MIIFGWLCLTLLAAISSFWTVAMATACLGFSGRIGKDALFFLIPTAALIWLSYATFPFTVTVTP
jgi:hypothetical protein